MKRSTKSGKQKPWTTNDLRDGFMEYYKMHNKYPTSQDVDVFEFLPSSRSIQRRFGGLMELRKQLDLGECDFRSGEYSSKRAKKVNKRAHETEKKVYEHLVNIFGIEFVHREYFFADDKRTRTDFFIYCKDEQFSVDVFFSENRHSFIGCLNSKMRTYDGIGMLQYPVIFLQMNQNIEKDEINSIVNNKKNKLHPYQQVMTFDEFKKFCTTKKPRI